MQWRHRCACCLAVLAAAMTSPTFAVRPASVLTDHMVLQRGKAVPIWGTARPGEKVTVRFAGQRVSAAAGTDGRWRVRLAPMKAGAESRPLVVRGASGEVTRKDVLVGDVWIAGGQSNMGRDVRRSWTPADQRMAYSHIRFLPVRSRGSRYPQTELVPPPPPAKPPRVQHVTAANRWHVCTDETTPECCAVGFFFAERIYKETGIPQGLLWNAWAGSTAREWIPRFGWGLRPELADTAGQVDAWYPGTKIGRAGFTEAVDEIAEWSGRAAEAVRQGHPFPYPQPRLPEPDDGQGRGRGTTILYNGRVHPLVPYAIRGILWYQGESDYANRRYLPEIEAMAEAWRTLFAVPGEKPADLPFYFVQMQRCGSYMSPGVRDFQLQSLFTIPNAGMAVLLDLDMNLHPANKYDSGRRMALWALARDYGKDVLFSGPLYKAHRTEGDKVVVEFSHADGGLFVGTKDKLNPPQPLPDGKLVNLEITADGRAWVPAQSRIDGERLVVWADGVKKPTDVRYCWKSKADEPFLYGAASRLPAAQFNTTSPYALAGRDKGRAGQTPPARLRKASAPAGLLLTEAVGEDCVLQRDAKVPVWGRAEPGEKVTVTFAGQTKQAAADRFGRWRVELDPMPARAEPRPLVARTDGQGLRVERVYVGDVWLYLSQSWHLDTKTVPASFDKALPPICAKAADVWEHRNHSRRPAEGLNRPGRWSRFQPPGRYYRNDAYHFGAALARVTKAPVGVIGLGASTLESLTPPEGFQAFEAELGEPAAAVTTWTPNTPRGRKAYLAGIEAVEAWVAKTRGILAKPDVTFRDVTQPPQLPGPPRYERAPTTAYNQVAHRYMPAAFRGIVLQPKTFNVGDPLYLPKARALVRGLREACGRRDVPVCFVQTHSPGRYDHGDVHDPNDWMRTRQAQARLADMPNVTVLAAHDLAKPGRSEPDHGIRAARWAAAVVAGSAVRTGPTYRSHRVAGEKVVVAFDHVGEGLSAGNPRPAGLVRGFQLAGADGKWHDAAGRVDGRTVVVTCAKVARPAAVRYAWAPVPRNATLYNRAGFPALPFAAPAPEKP